MVVEKRDYKGNKRFLAEPLVSLNVMICSIEFVGGSFYKKKDLRFLNDKHRIER